MVASEDVFWSGRGFEPKLDIIAEEELAMTDGDDIARDTVVLGRNALGGNEGSLDGAENFLT